MTLPDVIGILLSIGIIAVLVYCSRPVINLEMIEEAATSEMTKAIKGSEDPHAEYWTVRGNGLVCRYEYGKNGSSFEKLEITYYGSRGMLIASFSAGRLQEWGNIIGYFKLEPHAMFVFEHLLGEVRRVVALQEASPCSV
jgi:hypothetical protein